MHIPGLILAILIGGVLFDLDAWGIALAIFFAGLFGALLYGGVWFEMGALRRDVVSAAGAPQHVPAIPNLWQTTVEKDMPNLRDFIRGGWDNRASEKSYMKILRGAKTKAV
jgi:hypothetical protein